MVKPIDLEVLDALINEIFEHPVHINQKHDEKECEYCATREGLLSLEMEKKEKIPVMFVFDPLTNFLRPSIDVLATFFILGQKYQDEMARKGILEALQEVVKGVDEHNVRDLSGLN